MHHADEGDELDLDAVIEAVVDRRTGHTVDDRLHVRRDRAQRDAATAFLVDLSVSTSSPIPDPEALAAEAAAAAAAAEEEMIQYRGGWIDPYEMPPPEIGRRILDVAKESVGVMCDALGAPRRPARCLRLLRGGPPPRRRARRQGVRRPHVAGDVGRHLGDALAEVHADGLLSARYVTAKLTAQPSRTKLLVVISDGYPQDVDYGPVRGDREYGLQDTALSAAGRGRRRRRVDIPADDRPGGNEYLRRMLPDHSYVVIDDVDSLPREPRPYGSVVSRSSRGW